jgi:predicted DNA-binding WGR domain protein
MPNDPRLSDQVTMNSNKFYKLQLLVKDGLYYVATNWGRLGEPGQKQVKGPHDEHKGITEFEKVFRSKTKNKWGAHPFIRYGDKYQLIETTVDEADTTSGGGGGGGADQALGRLTEAQIQKGQTVLHNIRTVLEHREKQSKRVRIDRDELVRVTWE